MPISSLSIIQTRDRKSRDRQREAPPKLALILNASIYLDDPLASIRASLLGVYPDGNEICFVTVPRAYCSQVPTITVNGALRRLVSELHRFERRTDKKAKRRLVRGYRETLRHLRQGHIKLLAMAIDIDADVMDQAEGPRLLLREAKRQAIPVIFALRREEMAAALGMPLHVETSILGVLNADGAYQVYQELATWSLDATARWIELALTVALGELKANAESDILRSLAHHGHLSVLTPLARSEEGRTLLRRSVDRVNRADGRTALMMAAAMGETEVVDFFLELGANALQRDFALEAPLHHAVRSGSVELVRRILAASPEALLVRNAANCLPIHQAIVQNCAEVVAYLASLTTIPPLAAMECLRHVLASERPNKDMLALFLQRSEELRPHDWSALVALCSRSNALGCLRLVLARLQASGDHGAVRETIDYEEGAKGSGTPAWLAAYLGNVAVARELIRHGANAEYTLTVHGQPVAIGSLLEKWRVAARTCE